MRVERVTVWAAAMVALLTFGAAFAAEPGTPSKAAGAASGDWPQWRGPNRDGVAPVGPKLLDAWPKGGPKMLWQSEFIPVGDQGGWGSPVVAEGKVFLYVFWLHEKSGRTDTLICLDAVTGKTLWKKDFAGGGGGYPLSTTPAVSNGKVYFPSSSGTHCLSTKDGGEIWHTPGGGLQASLLVDGDLVYEPSDRAFDANTGKLLWNKFDGGAWNSSPMLWNNNGKQYIVKRGRCYDRDNGNPLWPKPITALWENNSTPVIVGDIMVFPCGPCMAYKLTPQGASEIWKASQGAGSPLVYQDNVYCSAGPHEGDWQNTPWTCLDLKTGAEKWRHGPKNGEYLLTDYSSPILADGKVITLAGPGYTHDPNGGRDGCDILIFKATPEKYTEVGRFPAHAAPCPSPAIANGKLYVRTTDLAGYRGVACYDLRAAGNN